MNRMRVLEAATGVLLACVMLFGGTAHALIPHEHGDHHGARDGGSVIWQALHNSLRHEDKQALPVFNILAFVAAVIVARQLTVRREIDTHVDSLMDFLRRGIAPHRAFG